MLVQVKRGLDIPLSGKPQQRIEDCSPPSHVAVVFRSYHNLKPHLKVSVGDEVAKGQVLVENKVLPGVCYTSSASGVVEAIHRGERRKLLSIVIRAEGQRDRQFDKFNEDQLASLDREQVQSQLLTSGLWTTLRTRPYSETPEPDSIPSSIFVTAMDSRPLAADPQAIIAATSAQSQYFDAGLKVLSRLRDSTLYVCVAEGSQIAVSEDQQLKRVEFSGPHPAGLLGTHIHFLDPIYGDKTVWGISYQDVIAIGELFLTGTYPPHRVISFAGPAVKNPRLLRVQIGTPLHDICDGELNTGAVRIIAGSPLDGSDFIEETAYLGAFELQVSVLPKQAQTPLLAWLRPGLNLFSITRAFPLSSFGKDKPKWSFTCMQNGSKRAIVPIALYERVMPLDLLATQLIKSLLVMDTDTSQQLGCLELDEEDLALCSYVCPGKHDLGPILRRNLEKIKQEG